MGGGCAKKGCVKIRMVVLVDVSLKKIDVLSKQQDIHQHVCFLLGEWYRVGPK